MNLAKIKEQKNKKKKSETEREKEGVGSGAVTSRSVFIVEKLASGSALCPRASVKPTGARAADGDADANAGADADGALAVCEKTNLARISSHARVSWSAVCVALATDTSLMRRCSCFRLDSTIPATVDTALSWV